MYFILLIFICITLSPTEAGTLPRPYHPLRGSSRNTIRLYPVQMRDPEQPLDNYSWRRFNLEHFRNYDNFGDQDWVPVKIPNNNNMVLDIVRQMAENLIARDQGTHSVESHDPDSNLRSLDSIENSREIKNLFGSKGYVHLTYPGKRKNNLLGDIVRQLASNLRTLDQSKSVEDPALLNYNLRSRNLKKGRDLYQDMEYALLNPHRKQKKLSDIVAQVLNTLRMRDAIKSVETDSLNNNNNVRTFDTIVHFEEDPRRILDNDIKGFEGIEYDDLSDPNKQGLIIDVIKRMAKDQNAKDYHEYVAAQDIERRADTAVTPKLVYEFSELVI